MPKHAENKTSSWGILLIARAGIGFGGPSSPPKDEPRRETAYEDAPFYAHDDVQEEGVEETD